MEQATLPDEVLFALFKLIPPFETGNYATVSKKWATIITDNELWRSYCEQRWRILPSEKDIAKNWIIPTKKQENKATRIDWHKYYLLRAANDRQMIAVRNFSEDVAFRVITRKKKPITDYFAKSGFVDVKDVKSMTKFIHTTVGDWIDNAADPDQDDIDFGKPKVEPPGSIMDILSFFIDLELHMASKANITRVKSLKFTSEFLLEVQTCFDMLEMPSLELTLSSRLVKACKEYYRIGLQQNLPVDTVSEFYQATIELISACRSFKQRKAQLALLTEVLGVIADSLTNWKTDDTWIDWCNACLVDSEAQSPIFGFISAIKIGASIASAKLWYSFLTRYAEQHFPPKDDREQLTLFLLFACESGQIKAYLIKHKTEIISKYFEPILKSANEEHLVAFLFMFESVAGTTDAEFVNELGELALPYIISGLENHSEGVMLFAESALIGVYSGRTQGILPNLGKFVNVPLIETLLSLMASNTKNIVTQAAEVLTCLFSFKPELYSPELETKIGAAFQNVNPEFSQDALPFLVEIASVVESVSLPGVTEAFNQTLASYSNMADADPTALLKMTQFISYSQKPSAVLIDALPTVVPIVLNVIREDVALGMEENIFNQDNNEDFDEDEYRELEVPNQFLTVTDKRLANKAAAFAALANILHNMPTDIMMGYIADIIPTIASSVAAPGSEEINKDLRSCVTAVAYYISRVTPEQLQPYIEGIWHVVRTSEALITCPDIILNHLIELEDFLAQHAPHVLPSILQPSFEIIRSLVEVTIIDENDSVASGNLGYGELSKLFETIIAHSPDKKQLLPRIKLFFEAFEHELTLPNPELWTIYDMISAVYEHCAAELVPEDTFGLLKYLWAARVLETRYVSQTVAYTLSFLASNTPQLLPDTIEECIDWALKWLNTPNIREENAAVYDNVLVAYAHLLNLIKDDTKWIVEFKSFVKCLPPTEDGDALEGLIVVELFAQYSNKAALIGMDPELQADLKRAQLEVVDYVPLFK